jgi:ABC-type phosphate/phosphonate transport system substrate-binding protein
MKSVKIAACLALALLASGCSTSDSTLGRSGYDMGSDRFGVIPAADPDRAITVQDCTQPLMLSGGNLMCR